MERIEVNVATGERSVIDQQAYIGEEGDIIVLDSSDPSPDGYEEHEIPVGAAE